MLTLRISGSAFQLRPDSRTHLNLHEHQHVITDTPISSRYRIHGHHHWSEWTAVPAGEALHLRAWPLRRGNLQFYAQLRTPHGQCSTDVLVTDALEAPLRTSIEQDLHTAGIHTEEAVINLPGRSQWAARITPGTHEAGGTTEGQALLRLLRHFGPLDQQVSQQVSSSGHLDHAALTRSLEQGYLQRRDQQWQLTERGQREGLPLTRPTRTFATPANAALLSDIRRAAQAAQALGLGSALHKEAHLLEQKLPRLPAPHRGQRYHHDRRYQDAQRYADALETLASRPHLSPNGHLALLRRPSWSLYEHWCALTVLQLLRVHFDVEVQAEPQLKLREYWPAPLERHQARLMIQPTLQLPRSTLHPDLLIVLGEQHLVLDAKLTDLTGAFSHELNARSKDRYVRALRACGLSVTGQLISPIGMNSVRPGQTDSLLALLWPLAARTLCAERDTQGALSPIPETLKRPTRAPQRPVTPLR